MITDWHSYSSTSSTVTATYSVFQRTASQKIPKRMGIFNHFFTHLRSILHQTTNFYSIISNFDEVMPYYKRDHPTNFYISLEV